MRQPLSGHRCFKVPKAKLDLFLVALNVNFSSVSIFIPEVEFIFEAGEFYDVIVAKYGSYPYMENRIEEFVREL